jgi:hypothetical protein
MQNELPILCPSQMLRPSLDPSHLLILSQNQLPILNLIYR